MRKSTFSLFLIPALLLGAALFTGCGTDYVPGSDAQANGIRTLFLIVMENKTWAEVKGSPKAPYLNNTILPAAAYAENYRGAEAGTLHPSEPNYIWLEAGDRLDIYNDDDPDKNHRNVTDHLVTLMEQQGVTWRAYQEDITGTECPLTSIGEYKPKHIPMVFFDDVIDYTPTTMQANPLAPRCLSHVRPLPELKTDLQAGRVAQYNFITPNQCNDMHSKCAPVNNSIQQGDNWLAEWIPVIQQSDAYRNGGAILITWDEAELTRECLTANCPIGMIVLSPLGKGNGYTNTLPYDHSSTLKTVQEIFGVTPLLRHAGDPDVNTLSDLFAVYP